jgi:ribosome biogenesis GTPase
MTTPPLPSLEALGWQAFFEDQTDAAEMALAPPVRVASVHRNSFSVVGPGVDLLIPAGPSATVGDWLLLNRALPSTSRVLTRKSLIKRRAPGHDRQAQLIAANLDTAFIVTSCNLDFNVARLERYVALAFEAGVVPVIVLTKADEADAPEDYMARARGVTRDVAVISVDARGPDAALALAPWCGTGQTVGFMGSSGVGKSTLVNALSGWQAAATQDIRADDAKGRHTTTRRQLHFLPSGCVVLDTPGMRELQITDAAMGVREVFADLTDLAQGCHFNNCRHETEPGCAVQAAVAAGTVDPARVARWRKLLAEDTANTQSLGLRRAGSRRPVAAATRPPKRPKK